MHGVLQIHTKQWGYICVRPLSVGRWRWCAWVSPNATPWAATWGIGPGFRQDRDEFERRMVHVRRSLWGHGYDCRRLDPQILDAAVRLVELRSEFEARDLMRLLDERAAWLEE